MLPHFYFITCVPFNDWGWKLLLPVSMQLPAPHPTGIDREVGTSTTHICSAMCSLLAPSHVLQASILFCSMCFALFYVFLTQINSTGSHIHSSRPATLCRLHSSWLNYTAPCGIVNHSASIPTACSLLYASSGVTRSVKYSASQLECAVC